MEELLNYLKEKLWDYIIEYNPDLMFNLQERYGVRSFLEEKVEGVKEKIEIMQNTGLAEHVIREECMQELTADLRPSKFRYLMDIMEEEFSTEHERLQENGTLTYEVVNMIEVCTPILEEMGFCEEKVDDRFIRYAVMAEIDEYLK